MLSHVTLLESFTSRLFILLARFVVHNRDNVLVQRKAFCCLKRTAITIYGENVVYTTLNSIITFRFLSVSQLLSKRRAKGYLLYALPGPAAAKTLTPDAAAVNRHKVLHVLQTKSFFLVAAVVD